MAKDPNVSDSFDELWQLAEFSAVEALMLRSFLEYLRSWPDPAEKKFERLQNWRAVVGLQLGNPAIVEEAKSLFQKVRDAPPHTRMQALQQVLESVSSLYFQQ